MNRLCANISMLFTELPLLERFAAARDAGFEGVEILVPYAEPAEALARAAEKAGSKIVLINTPMGDLNRGGRGIAANPYAQQEYLDGLKLAGRYALELGVDRVNIIAGRTLDGDDRSKHLSIYRDNLMRAVDQFAPHGIRIDVEAVNPTNVKDSLLPIPQAAADVIQSIGSEWIDLQFDVFHTVQVGQNPSRTFHELLEFIGHVQFADAPDRHEPGSGIVDWKEIFTTISGSDYTGWISAEYRPSDTTESTLDWMKFFTPGESRKLKEIEI